MMIRLSAALLLLSLSLHVNAQQSANSPLPQNQPTKAGFLQCGAGPRYAAVIPQEKYLENGDSWGGIVGKVAICGGCDFADTPAHPTPNPPERRTYAFIEWGDGSRSDLQLWLPDGAVQVSSPHQYTSVIDPEHPVKLTMHAWCVNLQRNWEETITSTCDGVPNAECVPSPANIAVYENVAPSLTQVVQTVTHGKVAMGALSVVLTKKAPKSGTKVTLKSSSDLVTFREPTTRGITRVQEKIVTIPIGQSAANFDIDATAANKPIKGIIITVSNAGGPPITTTFDLQ